MPLGCVHTISRGPIQLSRYSLLVERVYQTQAIVFAKLLRKKNTENISDTPRNSVGPDVSLKA